MNKPDPRIYQGLRELLEQNNPADLLVINPAKELLQSRPVLSMGLDAPFKDFEALSKREAVVLGTLSNKMDMVDFRKVCHRASHQLVYGGVLHYLAHNPDRVLEECQQRPWPGEAVEFYGSREIYRPLRQHLELLRIFGFRPGIPKAAVPGCDPTDSNYLVFSATKEQGLGVHIEGSCQESVHDRCDEKYGHGSSYRRFNRLEEPEIVDDMLYAMSRMNLRAGDTVLGIGSNDGRELQLFDRIGLTGLRFIGLDASSTAIAAARASFSESRHQFHVLDLIELPRLSLEPVQGVLLLNVLQCTSINRDQLLNDLKALFDKRCAVLISIPNNHFLHGDLARRPLSRRDPRHDRSLVIKDLRYLTRYFYRANFKLTECFGSYDAFLLARR
jgi:hypothetical protein